MSNAAASAYALKCLDIGHQRYRKVSALMCWDAVYRVAMKGGCITAEQFERLKTTTPRDVLCRGYRIMNPGEMGRLPAGWVIYFNEGPTPVHAMISTGMGWACGNKNDCVGVGKSVGWEAHDLAGTLEWTPHKGTDILAPGAMNAKRPLLVSAFPSIDLASR